MRIIEAFESAAKAAPKKTALISDKNQLSFEDLLHLVHILDVELRNRGVQSGQTLLVSTVRPEFHIAFSLLLSLRSFRVIFSTIGTAKAANVAFDRAVVTELSDDLPSEKQILCELNWFASLGSAPIPDSFKPQGDGGTFLCTTSGSTGLPKFVEQSEVAFLNGRRGGFIFEGVEMNTTRMMMTLASSTAWACRANLRALLGGGSVVALGDSRDKPMQYIDLYGVNLLITTPEVLRKMAALPDYGQYLSSLDLIALGGAHTAQNLLVEFARQYHGAFAISYGSTELGGIAGARVQAEDIFDDGYVGDIKRDDLDIAFFDDNEALIEGATEGVIGFRARTPGHELASESPDTEAREGNAPTDFFIPGDVMRLDGRKLYFLGRVTNVLNHSGNKISLDRIQNGLLQELPVQQLVCRGEKDNFGIEQLRVVYVGDVELTADDVTRALISIKAGVRTARLTRLETLPMTATGKTDGPAIDRLLHDLPDHT